MYISVNEKPYATEYLWRESCDGINYVVSYEFNYNTKLYTYFIRESLDAQNMYGILLEKGELIEIPEKKPELVSRVISAFNNFTARVRIKKQEYLEEQEKLLLIKLKYKPFIEV